MKNLKEARWQKPVHQQTEKGLEGEEMNPVSQPENYEPPENVEQVPYENMPAFIQQLMDEHEVSIEKIDAFEQALINFKKNKWVIDKKINATFSDFFNCLDNDILKHNQREEKNLFPLLHERLLKSGEHSQVTKDGSYRTAVDMLEDDHLKFVQLSALTLNFLGLAGKLPDRSSQSIVSDLAFQQGQTLVEELKFHIKREEKTVFPLACQLIKQEEFEAMAANCNEKSAAQDG